MNSKFKKSYFGQERNSNSEKVVCDTYCIDIDRLFASFNNEELRNFKVWPTHYIFVRNKAKRRNS